MYIPGHFEQHDDEAIRAFVHEWPFATVVSIRDGAACADHLPVLSEGTGGDWQLHVHVARKNPLWSVIERGEPLLLVFAGPQAYVSPAWYSSPGVPTWNYAAVHLHVKPQALGRDGLRELLQRQMVTAEQRWGGPGTAYFDAERSERLLDQIGGARLQVERAEAKFKLSQNRPEADRLEVAHRLKQRDDTAARAVAQLMSHQDTP